MILRTLYLSIQELKYPVPFKYGFLKASRCLCNYVEREVLKPGKFRCEGFNRIVISGSDCPDEGVFINSCQVACIDLPFDAKEYKSKKGDALMHYYADYLRAGIEKCGKFVSIPQAEMLAGIDAFMAGGMKNEWLHSSRTFREHALKACLFCALDPKEFRLTLQVWRAKQLVFDEVIMQTDPDEIAFEHRFRNVFIENGELKITSRLDAKLWSRKLEKL